MLYLLAYAVFSMLGGPSVFQTSAAQALFVDVVGAKYAESEGDSNPADPQGEHEH